VDPVAARHHAVVREVAAHTTREPGQRTKKLEVVTGCNSNYSTDLYVVPHVP